MLKTRFETKLANKKGLRLGIFQRILNLFQSNSHLGTVEEIRQYGYKIEKQMENLLKIRTSTLI